MTPAVTAAPALQVPAKTADPGYWRFQALYWACYTAIGLSFAIRYVGLSTVIVVGYGVYPFYSIGLTHLLHLRIQRRRGLSLPGWQWALELAAAVVSIGLLQTLLIATVDALLEGKNGLFYQPDALFYTAFGTTSAVGTWAFVHYLRHHREQRTQLQLALREAELSRLEAQINPHFLFNCLNSIRALVAENPERAQEMITRLANIFRYNLHREPMHTVPLSSELEAVGDYLALESVRFEDRLRVQFDIAPGAEHAAVPSMLLQTLVENALKHGIAPLPSGGDLLIRAERSNGAMKIEVENTGKLGPEKNGTSEPGGVGLANTRERLRLLYGDRASLQLRDSDAGRVIATVLIPA